VAAVVFALLGGATACRGGVTAEDGAPRPDRSLTTREAEDLAVVRFGNFRAGSVLGSISAPGAQPLDAQVLLDFRRSLGIAVDRGAGRPALLAWDGAHVWVSLDPVGDPFHGTVPPASHWTGAALNRKNPVDLFLALVLELASDRPENPQLLQQSTARYLRTESVGGQRLRIFSGPRAAGDSVGGSRTTFWLDPDGQLVRFTAALGGDRPFVLTLDRDEKNVRMSNVIERLSSRRGVVQR